jgi:predicted nucleic acid-binding protein
MKIYLDVCAWCRPFDEPVTIAAQYEADTIGMVLALSVREKWTLAASEVIEYELSKINDNEKLLKVLLLYSLTSERLIRNENIVQRAKEFEKQGIKHLDSLHLALAEQNSYDVLLTVDKPFLSAANRSDTSINV